MQKVTEGHPVVITEATAYILYRFESKDVESEGNGFISYSFVPTGLLTKKHHRAVGVVNITKNELTLFEVPDMSHVNATNQEKARATFDAISREMSMIDFTRAVHTLLRGIVVNKGRQLEPLYAIALFKVRNSVTTPDSGHCWL
jgi:hypothetical protein